MSKGIKEAIILAGGLGTRLSETVPGTQKCMAPVHGIPFLYYIINYLKKYNTERYIFSLGHHSSQIVNYLGTNFSKLNTVLSIEDRPLGTGGAIKKALEYADNENVLVMNGDTFFSADLYSLQEFHQEVDADCTIALKPMRNFDRYGIVETDEYSRISAFHEKKDYTEGLINGGIYFMKKNLLQSPVFPESFSFEKDFLEKNIHTARIYGQVHDEYFIDIGIPEDYHRAQQELGQFIF